MEERIEELEKQIKDLLNDKKYHQIRELLVDLNEADIAEIIKAKNTGIFAKHKAAKIITDSTTAFVKIIFLSSSF